jgi:hypothetical protein
MNLLVLLRISCVIPTPIPSCTAVTQHTGALRLAQTDRWTDVSYHASTYQRAPVWKSPGLAILSTSGIKLQ